ncbi:MAG: protein-L-isoaspartate(D-aspartate) O-methyltransferase [Pyrinomonadaceae bacterium]
MNGTAFRANGLDEYQIPREKMVAMLRDHYRIEDARVLAAMNTVPRHMLVPEALKAQAYKDNALPISSGQTISQPFIVARMTELLGLTGNEKVLEIGAGSGYQTAVLAMLARKVFSVERIDVLAKQTEIKLRGMGVRNFSLRCSDGTEGWPVYAPYDAILVAAGSPGIPDPLIQQLKVGGRLVIPIGSDQKTQVLIKVTKTQSGSTQENFGSCAFVPLIGSHGWGE